VSSVIVVGYNTVMPTLTSPQAQRLEKLNCPFDRFIVLANPRSSGRKQAERKLHALTQLFPEVPVEHYETATGGAAAYAKLLRKHAAKLGPHTLLCVAAGDGSINYLLETLLLNDSLPGYAKRTPILPLWGGNGNDLAAMLNGRASRVTMYLIFNQAQVVPIRPMYFRMVQADGKTKERVACVTASFGATAQAARRLNDGIYRQSQLHKVPGGRYVRESLTAWWAIAASATFISEHTGKNKQMYEYTFCNGPRMAKWYHMPVRLTDDQFFMSTIEGKIAIITPTMMTLSFRRKPSDTRLFKSTQLIVRESVWAQFDGEPELIPANTKIDVRLTNRPFYAFSTVLARN
jgi:hypothetical protein